MILDKKVKIKITKKNIEYYNRFYENISLKDIIEIETETQLQKGSNLKINVSCDLCNIERYIKYQAYIKNINSCIKHPIYTCDKCSHIKLKEYNKDKYGVEYYSQHPDRNERVIKTSIKKYGVEHFSKSKKFKEKVSKTNLKKFGYENPFMDTKRIKSIFNDKYGVNHPSQVIEFYNKIRQTNIEKTGYESHLLSPIIREKIKETNLEKYGGHPMKNKNILDNMINTNLQKYGYKFILSIPEKRELIKNTNLLKYGVTNPMMSEEIRKYFIVSNDINYIKYLGSNYSLFMCIVGHEFAINIDNYHSRIKNNLSLCTVCNPIGDSRSIKEDDLYNFISSNYTGEIVRNYRDKLEIDIYLPDLGIGFEFNGIYWHSDKYRDKNYHSEKNKYFSEKGIRIINIWEDDWSFNSDIIKSQIKNWIGKTDNKLFARKCKVVQLDSVSDFLKNNHIQGADKSNIKLGLYYNDELVSVMTFNNYEGRKKMEKDGWNLSRFCNKIGIIVVGGASKLLKYFIKNYTPVRIISYADKDWSFGNLYQQLGFSKISEGIPDYKYVINNKRVHKSNFRKSKLKYTETETEYIKSAGLYKIWDCGKIKYEIIPNMKYLGL